MIPAEPGLENQWRTWRRVLAKFHTTPPIPVRILEIGAYRGEATAWFLRNLCAHPSSRVHAVDTFGGSPEYTDTDFTKIEQAFRQNIRESGRSSRVVTYKSLSYDALIQLNQRHHTPYFDVVLVDASHQAHDVMSDAVLAFPLLKEGGVMIFDDYQWDKLVHAYDRPKIAIDAFVAIMQPHVRLLKKGWQVLLEKVPRVVAPIPKEPMEAYLGLMTKTLLCELPGAGVGTHRRLSVKLCRECGGSSSEASGGPVRVTHPAVFRQYCETIQHTPMRFVTPEVDLVARVNLLCSPVPKNYMDVRVRRMYASVRERIEKSRESLAYEALHVPPHMRNTFYQCARLWKGHLSGSKKTVSVAVFQNTYHTASSAKVVSDEDAHQLIRLFQQGAPPGVRCRFTLVACHTRYSTERLSDIRSHPSSGDTELRALNVWSVADVVDMCVAHPRAFDVQQVLFTIPYSQYSGESRYNRVFGAAELTRELHYAETLALLYVAYVLNTQAARGSSSILLPVPFLCTVLLEQCVSLLQSHYREVVLESRKMQAGFRYTMVYAYNLQQTPSDTLCTSLRQACLDVSADHRPHQTSFARRSLTGVPRLGALGRLRPWYHAKLEAFESQSRYMTLVNEKMRHPHAKELREFRELLLEYQVRFYILWSTELYRITSPSSLPRRRT